METCLCRQIGFPKYSSSFINYQQISIKQQDIVVDLNSVADIEQLFQMNKKKNRSHSKQNKHKQQHHQLTVTIEMNDKNVSINVPNPCLVGTLKQCLSLSLSTNTNKISYFQTKNGDWLSDYKLQAGQGWIRTNLILQCHLKTNQYQKFNGLDAYDMFKCIGVGGFSKVYLCRDRRDGTFYAAKFIEKQRLSGKMDLINNQRSVNEQIAHPFLVQMKQFFQTQLYYIMILDYCPGGELFHLQRKLIRFTQEEAKKYFIEVLLAIQYLHSKNILYRDIKPQNIMIDLKGHIQIADFGLAKVTKEKRHSFCGSLEYMSPEIVAKAGHSFEVDYYCLGVLLYEMVVGCPPFYCYNSSENQTKHRILYQQVQFPDQINLSESIKDLIRSLLIKDPSRRIGHLAGVKQIKCHSWIGWINKSQYLQKKMKMPYPVNLDSFNFDASDITASANRILHDLNNQKFFRNQRNTVSQGKSNNSKSKQKKQFNKKQSGIKNKQQKFKEYKQSFTIYKEKCYSSNYCSKEKEQKSTLKSNTFCIKTKKKMNHSPSNPKINKFQSIKNCYLRASNPNLSKFLRFPTQTYENHCQLNKQRRSYVRLQGQNKQCTKNKQKQLKKKKAKEYTFQKINRKI